VLGADHDESAIDSLPAMTLEFALRRCVELGHTELSIRLYRLLKMPEQALTASLRLDDGLERAMKFLDELHAAGARDERGMKALWMLLTQAVLSDKTRAHDSVTDTRTVLMLIGRSRGLLRLEEVIVLLDAQEALQDFRTAVCDSLNSYSAKIKGLAEQMSTATRLAESLRTDISQLDHQYGYVTAAQRCAYSKVPLLKASHEPFVVFPTCRHGFTYKAGMAMFCGPSNESVLRAVARANGIDPAARDPLPLWRRCFEAECPFCGEWSIQRITAPLSGDDAAA
jgi:hypothetical protein